MSLEFLLFDRVVFVDTRKKNKYAYTTEIPKYFNEKGEKKKKRKISISLELVTRSKSTILIYSYSSNRKIIRSSYCTLRVRENFILTRMMHLLITHVGYEPHPAFSIHRRRFNDTV